MKISPGTYKMRNGHTALVVELRIAEGRSMWRNAVESGVAPVKYTFWVGRCLECDEPKTWELSGRYSPMKNNHQWDIMEESACGAS